MKVHTYTYQKKMLTFFQDAWKHYKNPNFKFLWYEDMMENLSEAIQDIADFTNYKVNFCHIFIAF